MTRHTASLVLVFLLTACTLQPSIKSASTSSTSTEVNSIDTSDKFQMQLTDNQKALRIFKNHQLTQEITLHNIPPFDTDDRGEPSVPQQDYLFHNGTVDQKNGRLYFTVRNQATAGNVNATTALFAYNITDKTMKLLDKKEYTNGFGTLELSPDGNIIVFSDGSHGGMCENTLELIVLNLETNKEVASVGLSPNSVGWIEFSKWLNNSEFAYTEHIFKNKEDCLKKSEQDPDVTEKTYNIQSHSLSVL